MRLLLTLSCVALCAWGQGARPGRRERTNPLAGNPQAVQAGAKLFASVCGGCHGMKGEGGRGPDLSDGRRTRRSNDQQLFDTIKNGIPGGDMPPLAMPAERIWELVAFLRSLSAPAAESRASGDAGAGREIFFGKGGCNQCHMVRGNGGFLGPDLSDIGMTRSFRQLRNALLQPESRSRQGYEGVSVVTRAGKRVEGVARNHSHDSLQIVEASGAMHMLLRDEVREVKFREKSLMPDDYAQRLSAAEIDNLLAFIGGQGARRPPAITAPAAQKGAVQFDDIRRGPGDNWLTYSGDYAAQRHSPLDQIHRGNVARLAPQWTYHVEQSRRLETTPLVYDGVMYVSNSNQVDALDARTGRRIWRYVDDQSPRQSVNRGVALLGDRVFFTTSDAHLVALDRRTGGVLWHNEYASIDKGFHATLAPLALRDRVIVGVAGGDSGMRGFVAAISAVTGEELWRFWTVPARGEPGSETWSDFPLEYGGGGTWMSGSYDPDLNLVYWTTGNPWPDMIGRIRKGDNLYTCSVLALDADSGKLRWYFQFTPHDTHDWDAQSMPVLADVEVQGRRRKVLMHPNRNGFYYVLDRATGEFLRATPFVDQLNWATGIDAKGRPIEVPGLDPTPAGVRVCPSKRGASNWMSPSYSPQTGLFYVPSLEQCDVYTATPTVPEPMKGMAGGGAERIPSEPGKFYLRALDPKTGMRRWQYAMTGPATAWSGTVSTAGGLVFFGDDDGQLIAVDAENGRQLWHYSTGQWLTASPMTYRVAGRQYVAIAAGTDVFSFALSDGVKK
jgi:PQQ-dependent dehydrogenase (methanol/ethanol family)